ncbi:MAG: signal peptidase II [Candidatus Omnitrophota bacterium]|jgi:signal peptidase II
MYIFVGIIGLDQLSKFWIQKSLLYGQSVTVIGQVIQFTLHHNPGVAFGLARQAPLLVLIISSVFILGLIVYTIHQTLDVKQTAINKAPLWFITAGAVSNLADRIRYGHVVDFIDLGFWPVFNIADSAITSGAIFLIYCILFKKA